MGTKWQPFLEIYDSISSLKFGHISERDKAIALLWEGELRGLPHTTPDGMSLIVPSEAIPLFEGKGIVFTIGKASFSRDVSPATLARVRRSPSLG